MRGSKQSIHYYGPAEVRGKYARPAGNIEKLLNEAGEVVVKDNPVLSRPVTSGSLVAKGRVDTGVQADSLASSRPESRSKTPNRRSRRSLMDRNRPATANRLRTRTHSRLIGDKQTDLLPLVPDPVKAHLPELLPKSPIEPAPSLSPHFPTEVPEAGLEPKPEEDAGNAEEVTEETPLEEVQLPVERPATATTWKTTSSQRRYIDELERLLKEERKVRGM